MSRTAADFQNFGINALSIVSDAQSQPMIVVSDFCFDMAGNCVMEGVSDYLAADPIDFVLECWRQPSWLALDNYLKGRALPVRGMSACQFLAGSIQQLRQVVLGRWLRAQVTDGV